MPNETPDHSVVTSEQIGDDPIERLCNGRPDVLYLLSGVSEVTNSHNDKTYKPGSYKDVDWNGYMTGGKARALAVVELSKHFPEAIVAVNSNTFNIDNSNAPTDAEVMAEYVERKGVAPENIIQQDRSTTTFTELIELVKYIAQNGWKHAVVVAGETQKPRAEEMFRQIETLKDPAGASEEPAFRTALEQVKVINPKVTFVSSEDILPLRDKRYTELIKEARGTETWQTRETSDKKALEDLRAGNYWKNS